LAFRPVPFTKFEARALCIFASTLLLSFPFPLHPPTLAASLSAPPSFQPSVGRPPAVSGASLSARRAGGGGVGRHPAVPAHGPHPATLARRRGPSATPAAPISPRRTPSDPARDFLWVALAEVTDPRSARRRGAAEAHSRTPRCRSVEKRTSSRWRVRSTGFT